MYHPVTSAIPPNPWSSKQTDNESFEKVVEWIKENFKIAIVIVIIGLAIIGLFCIICCCCCRSKPRNRRSSRGAPSSRRGMNYPVNTPMGVNPPIPNESPPNPYMRGVLQNDVEDDICPSAPPMPSDYHDPALPTYEEAMRHPAYQKT